MNSQQPDPEDLRERPACSKFRTFAPNDDFWPPLLSRQLDAIALWIQHSALVAPIAGAPRSFQYRVAVSTEPAREAIDFRFRPDSQCQMSETHAMDARCQLHGRQQCRRHNLDARARLEGEEAGGEAFRRVLISWADLRAEVTGVEGADAIEIADPKSNVFDARHVMTVPDLPCRYLARAGHGFVSQCR